MSTLPSPAPLSLVVFVLDDQRYALRLSVVKQIVRAVEVTPLPQAPRSIRGVINVRGKILPVFDLRERFRLPDREPELSDCIIIAQTTTKSVACVVDQVIGVVEAAESKTTAAVEIFPSLDYIEGVMRLEEGLVFIHDLETFLSPDERQLLEKALSP